MKKKIMIISGLVLLFVGVFYVIYQRYSPDSKPYAAKLGTQDQLMSTNLTQYLETEPGTHVFFLDDGTSDAEYISSSLLIPLSLEFENALPLIEPVSFHDNQLSVISMKKTYNVDSLPAFVIVETIDDSGSFKIISSLSYDLEKPFEAKDIRAWFHENNLWNGPIATN